MVERLSDDNEHRNHRLASTAKPSKKPPSEIPDNVRTRTLVIASFWAIVLVLGLPVWIWTTSIHRSRLPLQDMLEWADGKACKPTFPLQIAIEAPSLQNSEAVHLVRLTQLALDDLNEFSAHHLRLRLTKSSSPLKQGNASTPGYEDITEDAVFKLQKHITAQEQPALTVRFQSHTGSTSNRAELQPHSAVFDVFYAPAQVPSSSSSSSTLATFIATELQGLFAEEQAIIAYVLSQSSTSANQPIGQSSQALQSTASASRELRSRVNRSINPELADRLVSRMTRSLKYAPTYHITISLFTPSALPSSWEIEMAIADYFKPLLDSMSIISNFSIDTQVQLFATLSPSVHPPEYDTQKGLWTLREEDLSGFINAAEWPLSPSIGAGPTINFVLYVPDRANTPLVVHGSQASSWLVPQWGGVVVLNPQDLNNTVDVPILSREAIQPALLVFSHQLLSFLGAPQSPPSLPLQLQTLTRVRALSLLLSASSTMGSLAQLTVALPSIAIPETVSSAVDTTLSHLRYTCNALKEGHFEEALNNARIAEAEAERGFFEKSMVGQVYFPDEHKVAVYLPLLGPVGVPLVMSALKELKRLWASRRAGKAVT